MDVLTLGPLEVPPLAVGAMFWGTRVPVETAHDLLDRAVDRGARFVDTANNYAFWQPGAVGDESETCLGEWIARRGRDRIVLATKIGARPARPGAGTDDALGLSRQATTPAPTARFRRPTGSPARTRRSAPSPPWPTRPGWMQAKPCCRGSRTARLGSSPSSVRPDPISSTARSPR